MSLPFEHARSAGCGKLPVALLFLLALAACAGRSSAPLEQARAAVSAAESDPDVREHASVELDRANASLQRLEAAWEEGEGSEEIEHLAYLTEQRAAVAEAAASQQVAQEQIEQLGEERQQVILGAREEEIESLREELQTRQTERGLVVTLGDILFAVDRAELQPGAIQQLSRLADFLRENPDRSILIEGHTDSTGSGAYNLQLSQQRAYAVEDFLISQGIDPRRILSQGYGEQYPIASNDTSAGRQENRRVEIVIPEEGQPAVPRA